MCNILSFLFSSFRIESHTNTFKERYKKINVNFFLTLCCFLFVCLFFMWLIYACMVFYIPNAPLIKWVENKIQTRKTSKADEHLEPDNTSWDKNTVTNLCSKDSSASALFEQTVSLSSFYLKLIYLLYYRLLFCDLTCEILVWLESNSLMNRWHLISGVQINIKYISIWFKTLLHKLMDFLQQEVNICYPDGIRLTQFIMLMYH